MTLLPDIEAGLLNASSRHAERLKSLWKLVTQRDLSEEMRFHAMLQLACQALNMELAVLGEFSGEYTARYVLRHLATVARRHRAADE